MGVCTGHEQLGPLRGRVSEIDEAQSVWTLKGDMGVLARVVDIRVDITEWIPEKLVAFQITGVTEQVAGSGRIEISVAGNSNGPPSPTVEPSLFARTWP